MPGGPGEAPAMSRKRPRPPAEEDSGGGGLYDFLPPPDPGKDEAAKAAATKKQKPELPTEDRSRVIFLDIDGVLVRSGSMETIFVDGVMLPVRSRLSETDFNSAALENLRAIVQQTGACIVLSSEWRRREEMKNSLALVLRGCDIPAIVDYTLIFQPRADLSKCDTALQWCERRAREIGHWLKQHPEVTAYVALDDLDFSWADSVWQLGTPLMKCRSVVTNPERCLTAEDAADAVQILLNPPSLTEEEVEKAKEEAVWATQASLAKFAKGPAPLA